MDVMEKYDVTDEDVAVLYELLDRMQKKYGPMYRDVLKMLLELTEVRND